MSTLNCLDFGLYKKFKDVTGEDVLKNFVDWLAIGKVLIW